MAERVLSYYAALSSECAILPIFVSDTWRSETPFAMYDALPTGFTTSRLSSSRLNGEAMGHPAVIAWSVSLDVIELGLLCSSCGSCRFASRLCGFTSFCLFKDAEQSSIWSFERFMPLSQPFMRYPPYEDWSDGCFPLCGLGRFGNRSGYFFRFSIGKMTGMKPS